MAEHDDWFTVFGSKAWGDSGDMATSLDDPADPEAMSIKDLHEMIKQMKPLEGPDLMIADPEYIKNLEKHIKLEDLKAMSGLKVHIDPAAGKDKGVFFVKKSPHDQGPHFVDIPFEGAKTEFKDEGVKITFPEIKFVDQPPGPKMGFVTSQVVEFLGTHDYKPGDMIDGSFAGPGFAGLHWILAWDGKTLIPEPKQLPMPMKIGAVSPTDVAPTFCDLTYTPNKEFMDMSTTFEGVQVDTAVKDGGHRLELSLDIPLPLMQYGTAGQFMSDMHQIFQKGTDVGDALIAMGMAFNKADSDETAEE